MPTETPAEMIATEHTAQPKPTPAAQVAPPVTAVTSSPAKANAAPTAAQDIPVSIDHSALAPEPMDAIQPENMQLENVQPEGVQPALDLSTDSADAILTARTESGALTVRIGETSLAMRSALESLLFVADGPIEAAQLARVLNTPVEVVESHLRGLDEEYRAQERGLRVAERSGRFQMVTTPAAAQLIETFLNLDMTTKLSAPALETLAIVAYRQPVTRAQVEAVRGVDCSGILRSLLQRGLIEEVDRLDAPGRPVLYGVTDLFMHHFGLTSLQELPPLQAVEVEQLDSAVEQIATAEQ